ncbi:GM12526 [Drosophila sechellia]|uniref:GM12526 n=1 Tax=Drosophila sechellia TaxID=7238 RepID=B4I058_DROSE|nr:GM12526 [Drosophila sechellia]
MQMHLYEHKEETLREAFKLADLIPVPGATSLVPIVPTSVVEAPPKLVKDSEGPSTSGQSGAAATEQPEPVVPGTHKPTKPPLSYVPPGQRYRCGFLRCGELYFSESAMRKHMVTSHKYSEVVRCPHCKNCQGQFGIDKYFDHLAMHKRYIFQCGACSRHNSRRFIERHIQERHSTRNVDMIVHRHNDSNKTTQARWLKAPKLARQALMEYTCNLCLKYFPTTVQIMAHAASVHKRNYQYHCPYCEFGGNLATALIKHILREHPERDVQPVQIYQRIVCKNKQTLGFYCTTCHEVASSFQKIAMHCEREHKSSKPVQCPHCIFGHSTERQVALHIHEMHPHELGLAVVQFERVLNEIPNSISWEMGSPIEVEPEKEILNSEEGVFRPLNQRRIVTEVVDLMDSEDETEELGENDDAKIVEFACTHCGGTNSNLPDLRSQHWTREHPDQPFYFRVQPLLLCSECKRFKGNAKVLREHLLAIHSVRNIVAADILQPFECAYCDYRYKNRQDLAKHISEIGHLPNDLKHVTDDEIDALMLLSASGSGGAVNEYYQCGLCSVVMPTKETIGQHGQVEHCKPGERFCSGS